MLVMHLNYTVAIRVLNMHIMQFLRRPAVAHLCGALRRSEWLPLSPFHFHNAIQIIYGRLLRFDIFYAMLPIVIF